MATKFVSNWVYYYLFFFSIDGGTCQNDFFMPQMLLINLNFYWTQNIALMFMGFD